MTDKLGEDLQGKKSHLALANKPLLEDCYSLRERGKNLSCSRGTPWTC